MTHHRIVDKSCTMDALVKQELPTLPNHMRSSPICCGVRFIQSLVFCVVFCGCLFVLFLSTIVFSFRLRFTSSVYPFGLFKHVRCLRLRTVTQNNFLIVYNICAFVKISYVLRILCIRTF